MKSSKRLQPYKNSPDMNCFPFILQKCSNKITWINSVNIQLYFTPFLKQTCIVMAVYQTLPKIVTVNGKDQHCWSKDAPVIQATAILGHTHKLFLDLALATLSKAVSADRLIIKAPVLDTRLFIHDACLVTITSSCSWAVLSDLIWEIKQSIHCI